MSGYFFDRSSEFREKMADSPFVPFEVGRLLVYCCGESSAT